MTKLDIFIYVFTAAVLVAALISAGAIVMCFELIFRVRDIMNDMKGLLKWADSVDECLKTVTDKLAELEDK